MAEISSRYVSVMVVVLLGCIVPGIFSSSFQDHEDVELSLHRSHARRHQTRSVSAPRTPVSSTVDQYSDWSQWLRCSRRCTQKRQRQCLASSQCDSTVQMESRPCDFDRCVHEPAPSVLRGGISRRLQDMVFNLLYHDWSNWSACTRSCKQRRVRTCAMKNWCKNVLLVEEKRCYHEGTKCEELFKQDQEVVDFEALDELDLDALENKVTPTVTVEVTTPPPAPVVPPDPETCGRRPASPALRIIGGYESRRGSWPWQVAIVNKRGEHYCGGVLLAPRWLLTAAHCIRKNGKRRRYMARVAEYDLANPDGSEKDIDIETDFVHPNFDIDTIDSDIALVKLKDPAPENNKDVGYACVPKSDDVIPSNTLCYAVGWGKVKETHRFGTDVLREAPVPLVDAEKCQKAFDYNLTSSQMCAGYKRGKIDTCAGDSGGPLMCQITRTEVDNPQWYAYGITSFGEGCGDRGKYGIYSKVTLFSNWIQNITTQGIY